MTQKHGGRGPRGGIWNLGMFGTRPAKTQHGGFAHAPKIAAPAAAGRDRHNETGGIGDFGTPMLPR
jgi:hypothetical protein